MSFDLSRAALRGAVVAVVLGSSAGLARAGTINGSSVTFGFGTGYAASTTSGNVATVGTILDGPGYLDVFHNVENSGGTTAYTINIAVRNITASPVSLYHFQIGVTNQNYYLTPDFDFDTTPDYLDADQDGDGIANGLDNAPFMPNPSQINNDGDGWGDAIDFRPNDAGVPLNFVGLPQIAPFLSAPGFIPVSNSATALGYTGLSSDTFANWQFIGNIVEFSGGTLAPDSTANFTLNINVPDGLENGGFVLRQYSEQVPEPTSALALGCVGALAFARRRRAAR
jgi:hypothetical protein